MIRVYLGGEGPNELGRKGEHRGVIEAMLQRICEDGWTVIGRRAWKKIVKLEAKRPTPKEERNVLGLAFEARRSGADVLAFVRDGDGDAQRKAVVEAAIQKIPIERAGLGTIGGVAVPVLEAWILAMRGVHRTEALSKNAAQSKLAEAGVPPKSTEKMLDIIENADFSKLPKDATTLNAWIETAKRVLPPLVQP